MAFSRATARASWEMSVRQALGRGPLGQDRAARSRRSRRPGPRMLKAICSGNCLSTLVDDDLGVRPRGQDVGRHRQHDLPEALAAQDVGRPARGVRAG